MLELSGQAKCVVVDSPLILSNIYGRIHGSITPKFEDFTLELFNSYDNINFFIKRKNGYFESEGRYQNNSEEAINIDNQIYDYLKQNDIKFEYINGIDDFPFNQIINELLKEN